MEPREVLQANLDLIDRVIGRVCRRARLDGADAEDFAASVKLALVDDDYAILRRFEGRSSLSTYLTVVVERLLADDRIRARGRWHPSAEAVRLGPPAMLLESLVLRERRPLEEALPLARSADPEMTRESAEALLARLPERRARPVAADLEQVPASALAGVERADAAALERETRRMSERAARVVRELLASLVLEDRMLVRFRFGFSMSIADISRMLRLPQRPLYRRLESLLRRLRAALETNGLDASVAEQIIESSAADELDFGLWETGAGRQSNESMERA